MLVAVAAHPRTPFSEPGARTTLCFSSRLISWVSFLSLSKGRAHQLPRNVESTFLHWWEDLDWPRLAGVLATRKHQPVASGSTEL